MATAGSSSKKRPMTKMESAGSPSKKQRKTSAKSERTGSKMATAESSSKKQETKMESAGSPSKKRRKMQTHVLKEGLLDIHTGCERGRDKWNTANFHRRYCVLQRRDGRLSLKVDGKKKTLQLDTAWNAVKCSTYVKVVTMDGITLCVMLGVDDVMTDWVVSLNKAIVAARCQGQTGNSESHDDVIGDDRDDVIGDDSDDSDDRTQEHGIRALSLAQANTEFLHAWFPYLDTKSYIIPSVHNSTVHVYDSTVGGHKVQYLKTKKEIKEQDNEQNKEARVVMSIDDILKRVHSTMNTIINKIAKDETMVIMTEVRCGLYASLYAGATDRNNNTHSAKISQASKVTKWDMKHDLADLLVVNRDLGLLLGAVIKNTGSDVSVLCDDIKNALVYLDKAEAVVNDVILLGVAGGSIVAVNKTILLPNLDRANLQTTIDSLKPEVRKRLEQCVGVQSGHDVTRLCLTKYDMADEQRLKEWWTACLKHDKHVRMGDEVYRALVAEFAMSLTTVEMSLSTQPRLQLWTAGHVVDAVGEEYGRDLTRIALFPFQVELLGDTPDDDDDDDVRILHGGPGTGKTILLLLRSVSWYRDGCDRVFNIQTEKDGQAAAYLVSHQLRETVARARQGDTVARPDFNVKHVDMTLWWDGDKDWTEKGRLAVAAWCDDAARSKDRKVHIIADEAN